MTHLWLYALITIGLVLALWAVTLALSAPEGYEDEHGFHEVERPRPMSEAQAPGASTARPADTTSSAAN